jgi:hypothetical protein
LAHLVNPHIANDQRALFSIPPTFNPHRASRYTRCRNNCLFGLTPRHGGGVGGAGGSILSPAGISSRKSSVASSAHRFRRFSRPVLSSRDFVQTQYDITLEILTAFVPAFQATTCVRVHHYPDPTAVGFIPTRRVARLLLLARFAVGAALGRPVPAAAQHGQHDQAEGGHDQGRHLGWSKNGQSGLAGSIY